MENLIKSNSPSMSEDVRAITQALLLASECFNATGLSGKNNHQGYKYAKIQDIYYAVEDALRKNNIKITHYARPENGIEYLYTRLIHSLTNQYIEDCRILESEKPGNQGKTAANTFMRKNAVLSLCAIGTEEDDDGEEEQKHVEKKSNEPCISQEQLVHLANQLETATNGPTLLRNILAFNKITELCQLKVSSFNAVKSNIDKNRK